VPFKIQASVDTNAVDRPRRVSIEIRNSYRQSIDLRTMPAVTYELDDNVNGEIDLEIGIRFPSPGEVITVYGLMLFSGAAELVIRQYSPTYVKVLARHGETQRTCTVKCITSGETRTGPGACIECSSKGRRLKICC